MVRKDVWLDTPVNIEGDNIYGEILYLDEMDKEMREDALALL